MKKIITLIAAVALGAALTGCAPKDEATTTTEKTTAPTTAGGTTETTKTTTETPK